MADWQPDLSDSGCFYWLKKPLLATFDKQNQKK